MAACTVQGRGALSVWVDLSEVVTIGDCGVLVETCLVWRLGVLSVYVDASVVVMTVGGTVCVEAWLV